MKGIDISIIRQACAIIKLTPKQTDNLINAIIDTGEDMAKREAFGSFIRDRRKALGLDQTEVVRRMGDIITPSHISNLENGKSWIGFDKIWALAKALEFEAWEIVAVTEEAMKPYRDLAATNGSGRGSDG